MYLSSLPGPSRGDVLLLLLGTTRGDMPHKIIKPGKGEIFPEQVGLLDAMELLDRYNKIMSGDTSRDERYEVWQEMLKRLRHWDAKGSGIIIPGGSA